MPVVTDDTSTPKTDTLGVRSKQEAFLAKALKRFRLSDDAESRIRPAMLDDLRFRASDQWPEKIRHQRELDGKPCLTINRLPQFIRQITNQQRTNKPSPIVSPVDSEADLKTAEIFQGMIRHIEQRGQAQVAYNTAGEHQATMGRGYIGILTEYENETSNNQTIKIRRFRNPFRVYMDPSCQELDYSDAMFAFVVTDLTKEQYDEKYGEDFPVDVHDFSSIGTNKPFWLPDGSIRVAEYWYVDLVADRLLTLATGDSILESRVPPEGLVKDGAKTVAILDDQMQPVPVVQQRKTSMRHVKCATITGLSILDGNDDLTEGKDWPGKWIPIIPVIGDELDVDGQIDLRGVVRDAKDPQRRYNFEVSAETEAVALAPKAPFVVADGQLEGYEKLWAEANVKNFSYLPYKAMSLDGHLVGPPQRMSASADISSMVMLTQQADNDLKATTGFYDASLGAAGPEQSGKAILARQKQGDIGSFNYQDNLALAIATLGRYLVDLIPNVFDAPRIQRILGEDGQQKTVMVHAGKPPAEAPEGVEGVYDMSAGTYDVTVSVGPSYASRRQEAVATMTQFVTAFPPSFPMVGDILVRHMDWPGAQEISKRMAKLLPPELKDQEVGPDGQPAQAPPPPELMQKLQEMEAMGQQMQQELADAKQQLAAKQIETASNEKIAVMEAQSRERIAQMQRETDLIKIQADLTKQEQDPKHRATVAKAAMDADSREQIAALQTTADLQKTQDKIAGAVDLAVVKAQQAETTARLKAASDASRPTDTNRTE